MPPQPHAMNRKRNRFEAFVEKEVEFVRYFNENDEAKRRRIERIPIKAQFSHMPPPVQPVSLTSRLLRREQYGASEKRGAESVESRAFAISLPLNTTIVNIDKPSSNTFIRRFTPNGRILLTYNLQNNTVQLHHYNGLQALGNMIAQLSGQRESDKTAAKLNHYGYREGKPVHENRYGQICVDIRQAVFEKLFSDYCAIDISLPTIGRGPTAPSWTVQKESVLFTPDCHYAIVLATAHVEGFEAVDSDLASRTVDALTQSQCLQQVQIVCISIDRGQVCDRCLLPMDKLAMAYNNGVQLCGYRLMVISMQQQLIHFLNIEPETGHFKRVMVLGSLLNQENELDAASSGLFIFSEMETLNCFEGNEYDPENDLYMPWDDMLLSGDDEPSSGIDATSNALNMSSGSGDGLAAGDQRLNNKIIDSAAPVDLNETRQRRSLNAFVQAAHRLTNREVVRNATLGLRQQIYTQLYKRAYEKALEEGNQFPLLWFHNHWEYYKSLKLCRAQFYCDETWLIIRFTSEEIINKKWSSASAASTAIADSNRDAPFLVIIYDLLERRIEHMFDRYDKAMLSLFERDIDLVRHPMPSHDATNPHDVPLTKRSERRGIPQNYAHLPQSWRTKYPCTQTSSVHAKHMYIKHKSTLLATGNNDESETARRLLASIPHASQSYNETPYLDQNLYRYDERNTPLIERPRQAADQAMRFHRRDSGLPAFTIYTGNGADEEISQQQDPLRKNAIVYYIWHPFEPLCFSVQRSNLAHQVNMHCRIDRALMPQRALANGQLIIK